MTNPIKEILILITFVIFSLIFLYVGMAFITDSTENETNKEVLQTAGEDITFEDFFNGNVTSNTTEYYQNITILDKDYKQRSFRSDVYNVVYKTETGDIQKDNNMTLYYSVEEGRSYNISGKYVIRGIVGEV